MKKQWKKMMSWFMTMFVVFFFCGGVYSLQAEAANGEGYLGVKTEAKVYDDFQNDIWLQFQQKDMQVGETATIYPWRLEQAITNAIQNDVKRPVFHFEIIKGDSISLNETESTSKVTATAEKPGTTVVKVTYDALEHGKTWGAISPVNTAYAVFTVGEEGKATITPSDNLKNWRHYDTIYYNEGKTVPYTFTVDTENAVSVKVTVNGQVIEGKGKEYTANLENRSNIIGIEATDSEGKIKSLYRVVDARFIEINVDNKTHPEKQNIEVGDTATISFRGITMPVYKLATIYNPQFGKNATYVDYKNEKLGSFKGQCGQCDLATNNDFEITFNEGGKYTFVSKGIYCAWWGSELGTDITKEGSGEPNLNAPTLQGWFSAMPEFTVDVTEKNIDAYIAENMKKLETYKDSNAYRDPQKKELEKIIADAKIKLEKAVSAKEVDAIVADARVAMDAVKTDAQLTAEENAQQKPGTILPPVQVPNPEPQTPVISQPQKKAKVAKVKVRAKAGKKAAKLSWKRVKKASGYRIYRAASKKGVYKRVKTVSRKTFSFVDRKVERDTKYFYKVCAYKKIKGKKVNGPFSKTIMVKVK